MEQSPSWEAKWFSASQEILHILYNPKVHFRIHKCQPSVPILSHLDPVHTAHPTSWRSILILSSHLGLGLFPSVFPTKTQYTLLVSPIHATRPAHLIPLDFITRTIWGEEYRSLTLRWLMSYIYMEHPFLMFLDQEWVLHIYIWH